MREVVYMLLILVHEHGTWGEDAHISYQADHQFNPSETQDSLGLVKRSAKDPFSRRSGVDKNFIRFGRSGDYFHEPPSRKEKNLESFSRVSRATRDNFMRFGRPEEQLAGLYKIHSNDEPPLQDESEDNAHSSNIRETFARFARGKDKANDNFMRYGKAENFMRFGRAKDNFMRFGRAKDNFMRFGRAKDNFMRFGRAKDNFMRFGRAKDNFMRFGRAKDNFMRFGRIYPVDTVTKESDTNSGEVYTVGLPSGQKQTKSLKSQSGFIRFGRKEPEALPEEPKIDDDGSEIVGGDLDLQADKPKHGPIIRIKRDAQANTLWDLENERDRRDIEVMDQIALEGRSSDLQKRFVSQLAYYDAEPEWILTDEDSGESFPFYGGSGIFLPERKRGGKESNLIRYG